MTKWSEHMIARALARQTFERKHLVIVPNCSWTGYECDLLVVTGDLRIIDVEVKISRADLKADARKDKWYRSWDFRTDGPWGDSKREDRRRAWPHKVWKHYYAMPKAIWKPELVDCLGSPASGVILLQESNHHPGMLLATVERRAMPCRDADKISPADAVNIARLASLRMWDAYEKLERMEAAA